MIRYISFGVFVLIWSPWAGITANGHGNCNCAIFDAGPPSEPLFEHQLPLNMTCDEEGSQKCLQLCVVLAEGAKDRAVALICEKLQKHVENVKISLYSRVCGNGDWTFTGVQRKEGICCHDGKESTCKQEIAEM